jgi:mono/diheme cytochrome c family protein
MRHHIVTRIVVSLAVVCLLAVVLFAWGVTRPSSPSGPAGTEPVGPTGDALFARHCAMCHDADDVGIAYRKSEDREAAAATFREFLVDHYGPSPGAIALIVSHVMDRP